jgi:hypothetical protein
MQMGQEQGRSTAILPGEQISGSQGKAQHTSGEASLLAPASDGVHTAQPQGLDGFGMVPLGQLRGAQSMDGHVVPPAPPLPPVPLGLAPPAPPSGPAIPPDETAPPAPESSKPCDVSVLSLQAMPRRPTKTEKPKPTLPERACSVFFMSHPAVWAANPVPKHNVEES